MTFRNNLATGCYKMLIFPISSLENKFDPRNTACMPAVKLIFRLELEKIIYSVTTCRIRININWKLNMNKKTDPSHLTHISDILSKAFIKIQATPRNANHTDMGNMGFGVRNLHCTKCQT